MTLLLVAGPGRAVLLAVLAIFCIATTPAAAQQDPVILLGAIVETNYSTQPGVQLSYGSSALGGRPRFSASYSTTRLATTRGSNALAEDRVQAGAGWYFRPASRFRHYLAVNAGYARYDREDAEIFALLDGGGAILSLLVGAEGTLGPSLRVNGNVGYSALHSSTVYPFVATIGLHYHLNRGR
jgi:opacity protein-like surface antigen